jgi:hypothetical protein
MQPTFTPPKSPTRSASFKANSPNPTLNPNGDDGDGGDAGAIVGAANNAGAQAAIGVLLPISIIIILVVGYLILCRDKKKGFGDGADNTVDLNDVGSYTI